MTRRQLLLLLSGIGITLPRSAGAIFGVGDIVLDPTNLIQNTFTATRSLLSNQQEARMILQNVQQIAQDAKHLLTLPMNLVGEIEQAMQAYANILNEGRGQIGAIQDTVQQYEQLFSSGWNGNGALMEQAKAMLGRVRQAGHLATRTGKLYDRLTGQQRTVNRLLVASQAAPGSVAAQQATNQLLGTLAEQQGNMQLLMASQNELQTSWIMSQVVAAEQAAAHGASQAIDAASFPQLGPGMGRGARLP